MVITVSSPTAAHMWESRDELGFPGHGAHSGAGFQKGSACSNRHSDGFGWIFKGLQLSSQYDPTRPTLNVCLIVTEPKRELSSFENPALI